MKQSWVFIKSRSILEKKLAQALRGGFLEKSHGSLEDSVDRGCKYGHKKRKRIRHNPGLSLDFSRRVLIKCLNFFVNSQVLSQNTVQIVCPPLPFILLREIIGWLWECHRRDYNLINSNQTLDGGFLAFIQSNSKLASKALMEDTKKPVAATSTQIESRTQLLGTGKLFHFLGSCGAESLAFHWPVSIPAVPPVSRRQRLHVDRHAWNLVSSSTTPIWLKLSSTPFFCFNAPHDYTGPSTESNLLYFEIN